ncbi:O-succinylhomoserine sulfhydrylase [Kordiimonas sediminis]|uniref:O-succinylhomoserine sulfhydrylase n=1 Tax=Kordiimonas sediminis TaxID=1735581 RepID=A0A919AN00_9PROT|nr:O-succinylhomoserine sulfhydrylase [Kordiimonas sediminis]GHF15716.1 O-succinylhomoserine sulfhydrylase [Kordiimonas sediminis]
MRYQKGTDRKVTSNWAPKTQMVRAGSMRSDFGEMGEALFMTSAFTYPTAEEAEARFDGRAEGFTYSRQTNPTVAMLEERMALLEGAEIGRATGTGMAAMTASLLCQLRAGDHVVAARALFGSCRWLMDELLPRYGIETTVVDATDLNAWQAATRDTTKVFFLETPANPTLEIADIRAIADMAKSAGARMVVDNVFATPVLQKPLALGADVVTYSTTKHIDGQGRCLGGMILCSKEFDEEFLYPYYRHTGCAMSPFNAWVMLKGMETLDLRVNAMCDNAEYLAEKLSDVLDSVRHPSLSSFAQRDLALSQMTRGGTMVIFELPGGRDQAFTFMNALEMVDISNNLGDSRSIATHPWSTTHKALAEESRLELGITPGMIRFSVGLEDREDIANDVLQALKTAGIS